MLGRRLYRILLTKPCREMTHIGRILILGVIIYNAVLVDLVWKANMQYGACRTAIMFGTHGLKKNCHNQLSETEIFLLINHFY